MQFFSKFYGFLILALAFSSCRKPISEATPQVPDQFTDGFFVVCEGAYGSGNASISYVDPFQKKSYADIFMKTNKKPLGDQAQSMAVFSTKGYIVVQNSQKIEVVNLLDFKSIATIQSTQWLSSPRYFMPIDYSKAYISDWESDALAIIDLTNNTVSGHIPVGIDPEKMLLIGTELYVTNSGYSTVKGKDNRVMVINTKTDQVISTIEVGTRPMSLVSDKNGAIWVLCSGFLEYDKKGNVDIVKSIPASLQKINPAIKAVEKSWTFIPSPDISSQPGDLTIDSDLTTLLYNFNGQVLAQKIDADSLNPTTIINRNFYNISVDLENNYVVGSYVPNFTSAGKIIRYKFNPNNISAIPLDSFDVGIGPNEAVFK
jgi:YVTN family beta-propeller protein